mgnify:CR=1 FL=1
MSRLFRHPDAGRTGYASLALFAAIYLAAMTLVLAPGLRSGHQTFKSAGTTLTP